MPANKISYLVLFVNDSQVYASNSREIALSTPPPEGVPIEDKRILFVALQPDNQILSVHPLPQEEVINAELKHKKGKVDTSEE